MSDDIKDALEATYGYEEPGMVTDQYKHVCFVGQGPNQTSWMRSIANAAKFYNLGTHPNMSAAEYCDNFARAMGRRLALTGMTADKLAALLDTDTLSFCAAFGRKNLNERWNGKCSKGDKFDLAEGVVAAQRLIDDTGNTKFVLLGRNVAACFHKFGATHEFLKVRSCARYGFPRWFMTIPHTSGIVTWWNSQKNYKLASKALRKFCFE